MKVYLTTGTTDYLLKVKTNHTSENLLLMGDDDSSVILHETNGDTIFNHPRKYEVIESTGTFEQARFAVLNNIAITDEGRPLFEYRLLNRPRDIETQPGFVAIRALRPLNSNTYVLLTLWQDQADFTKWKATEAFGSFYKKLEEKTGAQPSLIFSSAPYINTYSIVEEE